MLERRQFLSAITAGMASTLLPSGAVASAMSPRLHQREELTNLVKHTVELVGQDGTSVHALVVQLDDGPECAGLEQYSIVFEGQGLEDGIYQLRHPDVGRTEFTLMSSGEPDTQVSRKRAYVCQFV